MAAWMVTDTAEHLVRQGVVEASLDPTVMRVRRPGPGEVLPELSYKVANEYGVPVHRAAEPVFPVDFMIVSVCDCVIVCADDDLWVVAIAWVCDGAGAIWRGVPRGEPWSWWGVHVCGACAGECY